MSNFIPAWKIVAIADMSAKGYTHRQIAAELKIAKHTATKWIKLFGPKDCPCGKPINHKGWCAIRVARSPVRQKFLESWTNVSPKTKKFWKDFPSGQK